MLSDPFNVKMKIVQGRVEQEITLNLVETFNLWHGISVEKILQLNNQTRRYVFIKGIKNKQKVITIWRSTKNLDYDAEKEFIIENLKKEFNIDDVHQEYAQVLINNDSALDLSDYNIEVKSLDPIFFNLQWGGSSVE